MRAVLTQKNKIIGIFYKKLTSIQTKIQLQRKNTQSLQNP